MLFAVREINRNPDLLPSIKLGYRMFDNCVRLDVAFRAATALVSGTEEHFSMGNCSGLPPVLGIVGDPGSTHSIAISSVLGLFRVPMVCTKNNTYSEKSSTCFGVWYNASGYLSTSKQKGLKTRRKKVKMTVLSCQCSPSIYSRCQFIFTLIKVLYVKM